MRTRRECLLHSRMERLIRIFDSPNSAEHALAYVHVGLGRPPPVLPHPDLSGRAEIIEHFSSEPRARYITNFYEHTCSVKGLHFLMSTNIPWSESRMLVLWMLRKFDCFESSRPRECLACQQRINRQEHVSFAGISLITLEGEGTIESHIFLLMSKLLLAPLRALWLILKSWIAIPPDP